MDFTCPKTMVQMFGRLLDKSVKSIHACGEDIDILDSFKYLESVVQNNGWSHQEVLRWIGLAHGVMDSLSMVLSGSDQMDKDSNLQIAGDPCLTVRL